MNKVIIAVSILLGLVFLVLAGLYFVTPAQALPHFIPGFAANLTKRHYTHGLGSLIVAVCFFTFAWFQSGKKSLE